MTPTDEKPAGNPTLQWVLLFVPVVVALAASTMLLVDYSKPAPVFCSQMGGCEAIKATAFARPFGIPMPWFGLLGFALVAGVLLARGPRARGLHLGLAVAGALVGVFLLCVQLVLGHICVYCTITDVSALVGLGAAWWRTKKELDPPKSPAPIGLALGLVASSVATPAVVGSRMEPKVPPEILAELKQSPPGQITIVDFVDFQCPFCRQTHADLKPILEKHPGKFRVVRKEVPLSFHSHARDAARAECCAELLGRGDAMADELMAAPVENLTPEGCVDLAVKLGLDRETFAKCIIDPATDKKIEDDRSTFNATGGEGLPTLWIDTVKVEGARGPQFLEETINAVLRTRS